jgi:hypothetical protein
MFGSPIENGERLRMITNHSEDFFGKKLAKFCPKYSDRCECVPNGLNSRSVSPKSIGKVGKARAEAAGGGGSPRLSSAKSPTGPGARKIFYSVGEL